MTTARDVLGAVAARGWTLGVAESLTAGMVAAELATVPGASAVLRGGVVAYATDLKASLLGVDRALLASRGAVDADVAGAMAQGARAATGADVGLATTGVAGPDPQDGRPPGLVFVAVATPEGTAVRRCDLTGDRPAVRSGAVAAVLDLCRTTLGDATPG
ncbi:CinA family protein [Isoptericola sediminis]|uniref:CinA family protein n=1 Tax=Isoptericola sediminis TaxID=2733572 RepID=A0A849KHY4_9MICO|nr:CinA family protein [Isoptericola sediminis]NNU28243.1 CinA family protein [Isoptericola sediminis]